MSAQKLFHTRWLTAFGLLVCRFLPRPVGYAVARTLSWVFSIAKPEVYHVLRNNLRHVYGADVAPRLLNRAVRRGFAHAGQTYYDFYNALGKPTAKLSDAVKLPRSFIDLLGDARERGQGVLVLAAHMSNFDLASISLGVAGFHCQALSLSDPPGGFTILNRVRQKGGHDITPISPSSLRQAILRLKSGGIVVSGLDRPVYSEGATASLFGSPAYLPWGSAKLALSTGATVVVVACAWEPKRGYFLQVSAPVPIVATGDRQADLRSNTERFAEILEGYVRKRPEQWLMFYPMWPDGAPVDGDVETPTG